MQNTSLLVEETSILEQNTSGVHWAAIFGGAVVATGITAILTPLGAALGFAWLSPWHATSESGTTVAVGSVIWLVIAQWIAAAMGGYFTGRLRTAWPGAHIHEVFFRDTVHGFLSWAVATIAGLFLFMMVGTHMMSHAAMMSHRTAGSNAEDSYIDELYSNTQGNTVTQQDREETGRLMMKALGDSQMAEANKGQLTHMVEARTNLSDGDATARVNATLTREKSDLDAARKKAAGASLLIALSLLIGAFVASVAGALGGAHRDSHYETGSLSE